MVWRQTIKDEMRRIQRQMDRAFSSLWTNSNTKTNFLDKIPLDYRKAKADFIETENEFILEVELPGIEKENIKLNVTDGGIELKAEKKEEKEEKTKESYSYAKSYAGFYRSIELPIEADKENMDASYRNGILTVHIPIKRSLQKYPNFSKRTLKERNLAFIASANFAKRFIQSSLKKNIKQKKEVKIK